MPADAVEAEEVVVEQEVWGFANEGPGFGWFQGSENPPFVGSSGISSPNAWTGTSSVTSTYLSVSTVG